MNSPFIDSLVYCGNDALDHAATKVVKPEYVKVTKGDGTELTNATLIGPYTEGDELTLVCESGGGKPIPSVSWWNGTHKMAEQDDMKCSISIHLTATSLSRGHVCVCVCARMWVPRYLRGIPLLARGRHKHRTTSSSEISLAPYFLPTPALPPPVSTPPSCPKS
ncbi:unnamed protein product [Timema podura]|uniref:Ig-like domain-containing protein n=1 Tax=Timema podura TaxID=61482 RepID=A0ABN7NFB5_TIMPD|nr:unnamed protein product [Timema podura]